MIELRYMDSYRQERILTYDNVDALLLGLSGCMTVPDHLKVTSLLRDGEDLGYNGLIRDLYRFLQTMN